MVRAYRTMAVGIESIVFAEDAASAKAATLLSARDAGYGVAYTDIRCRRAPEFDARQMTDGSTAAAGRPYIASFLMSVSDDAR